MNRKQLIVLWSIAILLCIGLVLSTYTIWHDTKPTIDDLISEEMDGVVARGHWRISKVNRIDVVLVNLIRYVSPILIIGGLLIYSLRDKKR